jgi:hypothetical protein
MLSHGDVHSHCHLSSFSLLTVTPLARPGGHSINLHSTREVQASIGISCTAASLQFCTMGSTLPVGMQTELARQAGNPKPQVPSLQPPARSSANPSIGRFPGFAEPPIPPALCGVQCPIMESAVCNGLKGEISKGSPMNRT